MLKNQLFSKKIQHQNEDILSASTNRIRSDNLGATVIIPHVCNNINVFGGGFSGYLSNKFPVIKENFHMLGNQAKLGNVQYITIDKNQIYKYELVIANMIAQNKTINKNNPRPLNYEALVRCMVNIRSFIKSHQDKYQVATEIHCPKFGSGLAGGNWKFIENLIEDIWFNIPVFIYGI